MKFFFLFIGISLFALNGAEAVKYECYLPNTLQSVGPVSGLANINVPYACEQKYPTACLGGNCTEKPQVPLRKKSRSFW